LRRLLALSAVCAGASTLVGNLLKSSAVRPLEGQQRTLAGREWLRRYVNGCAHQVIEHSGPCACRPWQGCMPQVDRVKFPSMPVCPVPLMQFLHAPIPDHLVGRRFDDVAQWLFWTAGKVLIGEGEGNASMQPCVQPQGLPSATQACGLPPAVVG
jgi:hypothetical protein